MSNSRRNQSKDPDKYWYSCRIRTKPAIEPNSLTAEDFIKMVKENCTPLDPVKIIEFGSTRAMQVNLVDTHIGAFAWEPESGETYDYAVIRQKFKDMLAQAKSLIKQEKIGKLYLCFLGDVLHVDNSFGTTTSGTYVDHDGRFKKMVDVGYEIILQIINEFSFVPDIEVHWVEGNHSRDTEYAVFCGIEHIFSNRTNIKFNISHKSRTAFLFGKNLVGLIHGDMPQKQKSRWLQLEYPEWWSASKYREVHEGHTHKEGKEVDVEAGVTIRTCLSPKNTDKYEYVNAWINTPHGISCFIWEENYGLESIRYFR